MKVLGSVLGCLAATLLTAAQTEAAVKLPMPGKDGYIKLFRGDNAADWYSAVNGPLPPAQNKQAFPNTTFSIVKGDTIKAAGNPHGQVYFNQSFSHYHIRYEMHFPGNQGNCGMLLHVQENDTPTNGFPRAIESQGDPSQGMGEAWPIGDVWVTVHAKLIGGKMTYDPTAPEVVYGGKDWNSRVIAGKAGWGKPSYTDLAAANGGWVTQESDVHGSDSVIDFVQGDTAIKYRNPIVSSGGTPDNVTKHLTGGLLGWQSEGTETWYRNIEIRLYPDDPLYQTTYVAFNADNSIRPKREAGKILNLENGILSFKDPSPQGRGFTDARGRSLPKLLSSF